MSLRTRGLSQWSVGIFAALAQVLSASAAGACPLAPSDSVIALVGGTVIDGNGGSPMQDATIVIVRDRITTIGPRATTVIPPRAWQIDVRGKYLTPGFTDTNVHMSAYDNNMMVESQRVDYIQHAAKGFLEHGVTTVRDTYGILQPLLTARDVLQQGAMIGARILVAGNIIGLDNQTSGNAGEGIVQGMGRNLLDLSTDSLRVLTDRYLDKGIDFMKIAVDDHGGPGYKGVEQLFSQSALETMIREAHQRGKLVDSHTETQTGFLLALHAGVDVLQHPELESKMTSEVAHLLATRRVICSIFPEYDVDENRGGQGFRKTMSLSLMQNGCLISVATDDVGQEAWGHETLEAIEDLVTIGLTPMQALTAATRTGAMAVGVAQEYGTLEVGKHADIIMLGANPLTDIHNIWRQDLVVHQGYVIDRSGKKLHAPN